MASQPGAFGASQMRAQWTVVDLLLWQAAALGNGLAEHEPVLVDYMVGYLDWMRAHRIMDTKGSVMDLQGLRPGVFEWPEGSSNQFYGVESTLIINEVI